MCTRAWYSYNRSTSGASDPINYFYVTSIPGCVCSAPNMCAILGCYQDFSEHPQTFSARLNSYITNALAFGTCQPTTGKKYVYLRFS